MYLLWLPKFANEENIENLLNNYLLKNTKLLLDIENPKVNPNYKFDISLKADSIKLKYPNKKNFITIEKLQADINILSLFFNYIDLSKIKAKKIVINANFTKKKTYSCFNYFDLEIFNFKANTKFKIKNVKILCDSFLFNLYDENIKKNFQIASKKTSISFGEEEKPVSIVAKGIIKSQTHKIADFNLNLEMTFKKGYSNTLKNITAKLNYNPFLYADEYKFYSNADVKLKLSYLEKKVQNNGYISLKDYTFKVKDIALPRNNILILFKGDKIKADCSINLIKNQFIKANILAILSKNKFIELKINSNNINLSEFGDILNIFYKIFNPKLNTKNIKLSGMANANLYLKSNFKTITSKGYLDITNAKLENKAPGINLDKINSKISLENDKINILNTSAYVDKSKFYLTGTVDKDTNLNLKINSELINIAQIVSLVKSLPLVADITPIINDCSFKNGGLKINADIKGKINTPKMQVNSSLKDLSVFIRPHKTNITIKEILIKTNENNKIYTCIKNTDILNNGHHLSIPELKPEIIKDEIVISKSPIVLENIKGFIEAKINTKSKNTYIGIDLALPLKNNFLIIKNKNTGLKATLSLVKSKLQIIDFGIFDTNKKLIALTGSIDDFKTLNNLKISFDNRVELIIPLLKNTSLEAQGKAILNGKVEHPAINGNLILTNIKCNDLNLYIKEILLNFKNSIFSVEILEGSIPDSNFNLLAQGKYLKNKITINSAKFYSPYLNLDNIEKNKNKLASSFNYDIQIDNFKGNIDTLKLMGNTIETVGFNAKLNNKILSLINLEANIFGGRLSGNIDTNLNNNKTKIDLILKEINIRHLPKEIKEISIAQSGILSALINAEFCLNDFNSIIGYIKFNIDNGELTRFAKLERLLQAGNILSQSILKLTLNSTLSTITKQNTGYFKTIEGTIKLKNGLANIQYIKSIGPNMSLYITGMINPLNKEGNLKVLGKIPSSMVQILGKIGNFSTEQLVDKMSSDAKDAIKSATVSPIEKMMSTELPMSQTALIPPLANEIYGVTTRDFMAIVSGNIESSHCVKYFKWILNTTK